MPMLSIFSNPLWRAKNLAFKINEAYAPTLWDTDSQGFMSPSGGRELSSQEAEYMHQYNSERAQLNELSRKAVDALMQRIMPLSNACFKEITDFQATAIAQDIAWLHDHPAGSDFYNSLENGWMINPDQEGDWRLSRLTRYLKSAELEFNFEEIIEKVNNGISTPIIINLDGNGVTTTSLLSGQTVLFDIDGDGTKDETAWITGNNAFLAIDSNGNGVIDDINELFGGSDRGAGFAKLAEFDSNGDGRIDKNDDRFLELLLWKDSNQNGITDRGELVSAWAAGIESINLNYTSQDVCQNGNLFGEVSSAVYQGQQVDVIDVYFRFRPAPDSDSIKWQNGVVQSLNFEMPSPSGVDYPLYLSEYLNMAPNNLNTPMPSDSDCTIMQSMSML